MGGEGAALRVSGDTLAVEYVAEKLAIYKVKWHPDRKRIHGLGVAELFPNSQVPLRPRLSGLYGVE